MHKKEVEVLRCPLIIPGAILYVVCIFQHGKTMSPNANSITIIEKTLTQGFLFIDTYNSLEFLSLR